MFDMSPEEPKHPLSSSKARLIAKGIRDMEAALKKQEEAEKPTTESSTPVEEAPAIETNPEVKLSRPLIYITFPTFGYGDAAPVWFESLDLALRNLGYLTYSPFRLVSEQVSVDDLESYSSLHSRLAANLCPLLNVPLEVTQPIESVSGFLQRADNGIDNSAAVLTNLWFLSRSSIVIADLERPMIGAETAAELVYARQLQIPTVGMLPGTGTLSPWAQFLATVLFSDRNLGNLLPLIQGYAPRVSK